MTDKRKSQIGLFLIVAALLGFLLIGCVCVAEQRGDVVAERIGHLEEKTALLMADFKADFAMFKEEARAGRDMNVNEPLTGWILAVGMVLLALTYPVGKILWLFVDRVQKRRRENGKTKRCA